MAARKPKSYEGSPTDKKADKTGAKKAGVSLKTWEKSAADKKKDSTEQKKLMKGKK